MLAAQPLLHCLGDLVHQLQRERILLSISEDLLSNQATSKDSGKDSGKNGAGKNGNGKNDNGSHAHLQERLHTHLDSNLDEGITFTSSAQQEKITDQSIVASKNLLARYLDDSDDADPAGPILKSLNGIIELAENRSKHDVKHGTSNLQGNLKTLASSFKLDVDSPAQRRIRSCHFISKLLEGISQLAFIAYPYQAYSVATYQAFINWKWCVSQHASVLCLIREAKDTGPKIYNDYLELLINNTSERSAFAFAFKMVASQELREIFSKRHDELSGYRLKILERLLGSNLSASDRGKPASSDAARAAAHDKVDGEIAAAVASTLKTLNDSQKTERDIVDRLKQEQAKPQSPRPNDAANDAVNDAVNDLVSTDKTHDGALDDALDDAQLVDKQALVSLPIFTGISKKSIDKIVQHGSIREIPKGRILFNKDEQARRFYLILKGWVRVFCGNLRGDEATIQILKSGDSALESVVFTDSTYPANAQTASDTTVFSIAIPVLRQLIAEESLFAQNLLSSMSSRLNGIFRQIDSSHLQSVDERLGSFLLQLLHEQGHYSRGIALPFSKSLVASYLNMKSETLSRALQRLRRKGFIVDNNVITIPDFHALCQYCDKSGYDRCKYNDSPMCPHNAKDKSASLEDATRS